jgi:hypothetical protein
MLVYVGLGLAFLSSVVGYECMQRRSTMPPNPFLLQTVSGASALCILLLFFFGGWEGFFAPIIGCALGFALCFAWWSGLNRFIDPPLVAIVSGIGAIGSTIFFFL